MTALERSAKSRLLVWRALSGSMSQCRVYRWSWRWQLHLAQLTAHASTVLGRDARQIDGVEHGAGRLLEAGHPCGLARVRRRPLPESIGRQAPRVLYLAVEVGSVVALTLGGAVHSLLGLLAT